MRRVLIPLLGVLLLAGCAPSGADRTQAPGADGEALRVAQTYYLAGEAAYDATDYGQASALWKRAVIELPRREAYDGLRHKLLIRASHGQLMAYGATGDRAYLDEGIAMLEAYLERHEELLGDSADARAQREQVFELVGEMEVAKETADATAQAPTSFEPESDVERAFVDPQPDPHENEVLDADGLQRDVRVRTADRPDVNDPATRAKLASPFANDLAPGVLTKAGSFRYAPRALVRLTREPSPGEGSEPRTASRVGRSVVSVGRKVLQDCYEQHLGEATEQTSVVIGISVGHDGTVTSASLVEGDLGSPQSERCILQGIESVQLAQYDVGEVRAALHLTFFLDVPAPVFEMAVQPFGPFDAGDSPNTMPGSDLQSDRIHRDYR